MARILIAALLCASMASSAFGADAASEKYSKTPPKKTPIIMGALIGAGAGLIIAGHKQYPDRPDNNPLTWGGVGLAGGPAVVVGLHYAFRHPTWDWRVGNSRHEASRLLANWSVTQASPRGSNPDHSQR